MRNCNRCQSEMKESFDIKVQNAGYGVQITASSGIFAKRIEKPKVAICPNCGEISLYIENLEGIQSK